MKTPRFAAAVIAMIIVVTASNILVQFPLHVAFAGIDFGDILTWGAFTYPLAFLVSDLTNRTFGAALARVVVVIGFAVAVVLSVYLSTPRIALASGTAFLVGQLLDISVFSQLRRLMWWLPPLAGSLLGSALDTIIFFSLAFAPVFAGIDLLFGMADGSLPFPAALLGVGPEVPLWVGLGAGDFAVKFLAAALLLVPYRLIMGALTQRAALAA
jgi:hypothetical protein